jgi:hypothetical protein
MRMLVLAGALLAFAPLPAAAEWPSGNYRIAGDHTLACRNADALRALIAPHAREQLGEINYQRYLTMGDCVEATNNYPIALCAAGEDISFVAQRLAPGIVTQCRFMPTAALVDERGHRLRPGAER